MRTPSILAICVRRCNGELAFRCGDEKVRLGCSPWHIPDRRDNDKCAAPARSKPDRGMAFWISGDNLRLTEWHIAIRANSDTDRCATNGLAMAKQLKI